MAMLQSSAVLKTSLYRVPLSLSRTGDANSDSECRRYSLEAALSMMKKGAI